MKWILSRETSILLACGCERCPERCSPMSLPPRWKRRVSLSLVLLGLAAAVLAQEVPAIEPTYTRVYGADSLVGDHATMSPNGSWIAFSNRGNLWVVPAEGGEPIRITSGRHLDHLPVWFPGSDRIAFRSEPVSGSAYAVMTVPVDPLTGRPTGPPRQVTLDEVSGGHDVSPDGKWIAYTTRGMEGWAIKVLPATGGTARTVVDAGGSFPAWSADGRSLYYVRGGAGSRLGALMRISVDGGQPETMFTWPGPIRADWAPNAEFVLRQIPRGPARPPIWEIATVEGRSLGRFTTPRGMRLSQISSAGDEILATMEDYVAPLRILPVDGGPARQLNEASAWDQPLGWKADGSEVFFKTELNGNEVLLLAPVAGGQMSEVRLPEPRIEEFRPVLSGDGNHVLYAVDEGEGEISTLKVFSLENGTTRELTRAYLYAGKTTAWVRVSGAGGTWNRDGENFLYLEKREGRYELWASPPRGRSRLLWAFGGEQPPTSIGVHGDRIAFTENTGAEASLLFAIAGEPTARRILSLDGYLDTVAWSPDGRWIATILATTGDMVLVEVTASGEIIGQPRNLDVPTWWWSPQWLPDARGIVVVGADGELWLIPLDPVARPVALTQDHPNSTWEFVLSPDGRYIACASLVREAGSIWRLDLGDALQRSLR